MRLLGAAEGVGEGRCSLGGGGGGGGGLWVGQG